VHCRSFQLFGKLIEDLLAFAKQVFEHESVQGDPAPKSGKSPAPSVTKGAHYEQLAKSKLPEAAKLVEELPEVQRDPPENGAYLWNIFRELHNRRRLGFSMPDAISFPDIDAWQRLRCVKLASWEIDAIVALDDLQRSVWASSTK
jgi:hypothetical protein